MNKLIDNSKKIYFPLDRNVFLEYFKKHGWTFDIYSKYIEEALVKNKTFRLNKVYPKSRTLRCYLNTGRISIESAIQLCELFNCEPKDIGIKITI